MKYKIKNNTQKQKNLILIRNNLKKIIKSQKKFNLRNLSRQLGKNDAYLQQYISRGSPAFLTEEDRKILSNILNLKLEIITPNWLISKDNLKGKFYKIKNISNNNYLNFPKDLLKNHSITNISSLIFDEIKFDQNNISYKIKVLIDTNINYFVDNNYYILKDDIYFFLVHLNKYIQKNTENEKVTVKPVDTNYRPFRINKNKISIFGKILFMSSIIKS